MKTVIKSHVITLSICLLMLCGAAIAATYTVPGDFVTIQEAINAAVDNSEINVGPGVYNENLIISGKSNLTIKSVFGAYTTSINANKLASVVTTFGAYSTSTNIQGITIDGFTLKNGYNTADGGGVSVLGAGRVSVVNSHIVNNSASRGGAFSVADTSSLTVYNSVIDNNTALNEGGAFFLSGGSTTLGNTTITRNIAPIGGSIKQLYGAAVSGVNNIIFGNLDNTGIASAPVFFNPMAVDLSYSDIELGVAGTGNINADPMFVNALAGNYKLAVGSPAIDSGTPLLPTDILGVARPQGPATDMGAYEYKDSTPPVVVSTYPSNGAVNISHTDPITVIFNENVVHGTGNITDNREVPLTAVFSGNTLTLTPPISRPFAPGATYTIYIPGATVRDAAGNAMPTLYSFKFSTIDSTPPTVSATFPVNNKTNVSLTTPSLLVYFNEKIVASNAFNSITINGQPLSASITNNTSLTLTGATLVNGTVYTVAIPADAVTDAAGNPMAAYSFSFTTIPAVVPTVVSTNPANGATNIPPPSTITVTFNEDVVAGTSTLIYDQTDTVLTATFAGNVMTLTPPAAKPFVANKIYSIYISADAVKNAAGNGMAATYSFFFITTDTTTPTVTSTTPSGIYVSPTTASFTVNFNESIVAGSAFNNITVNGQPLTATISGTNGLVLSGAALVNGTTYTVSLPAGAITDAAGNPMAAYSFSFTTIPAVLPTVVSTNPANGAINVPVNSALTVTFNENVVAGTGMVYDNTDYRLTTSFSGNTMTITSPPTRPFTTGRTYTIYIQPNAVIDAAGYGMQSTYSFKFTTQADTTAPVVVSTTPTNGMTNVDPATNSFYVNFSENIILVGSYYSITINGQPLTPSINGTTLSLSGASLAAGQSYTVSLPAGVVTDAVGNAMAAYSFSFTTTPPADTTAPTVVSTNPVNKARGISTTGSINITFSENVSAASAFAGITLKKGKTATSFTKTLAGNTLVIRPTTSLKKESTYTVAIPASAVKDAAGNNNTAYNFSFKTK